MLSGFGDTSSGKWALSGRAVREVPSQIHGERGTFVFLWPLGSSENGPPEVFTVHFRGPRSQLGFCNGMMEMDMFFNGQILYPRCK